MTPKNTKDIVQGWLEKGDHDLKSAEVLLKSGEGLIDTACYHCHKSVEKYLKCFLVYKKRDFPKSHDLDYLFKLCVKEEMAFHTIQPQLQVLLEFGSDLRYPAEEVSYSSEDAQRVFISTQAILKFIRELIKE